jgi:hypothetical protein
MSRRTFMSQDNRYEVVVGYDSALQTYFYQVWDDTIENGDEAMISGAGCFPKEIETVAELFSLITNKNINMPRNFITELVQDKINASKPSTLQTHMIEMLNDTMIIGAESDV